MSSINSPLPSILPQLKIIEAAFSLPLVSDTFSYMSIPQWSILSSPLVNSMSRTGYSMIEGLNNIVYKHLSVDLLEQASSALQSLDRLACFYLVQLIVAVPVLKEDSSVVFSKFESGALECADLLVIQLASYTVIQHLIQLNVRALERAAGALKDLQGPVVGNVRSLIGRLSSSLKQYRKLGAESALEVEDPFKIYQFLADFNSIIIAIYKAIVKNWAILAELIDFLAQKSHEVFERINTKTCVLMEFLVYNIERVFAIMKAYFESISLSIAFFEIWALEHGGLLGRAVSFLIKVQNTVVRLGSFVKDKSKVIIEEMWEEFLEIVGIFILLVDLLKPNYFRGS